MNKMNEFTKTGSRHHIDGKTKHDGRFVPLCFVVTFRCCVCVCVFVCVRVCACVSFVFAWFCVSYTVG